ncbi:MAG TPA: type II toxin-antitoxin system ParD family antitoxin [Chakrabartia sp.]|jgi:antitoxin ParD1/3/4|nr:type II toxin-antitoxin system ParD family antitoxin [Chakrabartia sp.]
MSSMNISLPDALKAYVDSQVAEGRYASASEYIRDLIRADEKAKAWARLDALLIEGLDSEETEWTEDTMDEIRHMARQ